MQQQAIEALRNTGTAIITFLARRCFKLKRAAYRPRLVVYQKLCAQASHMLPCFIYCEVSLAKAANKHSLSLDVFFQRTAFQ